MAGTSATKAVLSELAKRVPKNQLNQLYNFLELHAKYKTRVNKYPEKLPRIDWDNYRTNVRIEAIKMVDEFEKKYEELNKVFDDRNKLDTKKYYEELEKQRAEVQAHVKQYIVESNERIKAYEAEIARLCKMKPYSDMTMEEFINLRPEHADCIPHRRKPLFWPHDPEEQVPGPAGIMKPTVGGNGSEGGSHPITASDFKGKTEKFELNSGEMQKTKMSLEAKAPKVRQEPTTEPAPESKPKAPEVESFKDHVKAAKPSAAKMDEQKIHIDKPTPEEIKKRLDPCNLIETLNKKLEAAEPAKAQVAPDKNTICTSSKSNENAQPAEKTEVKPIEKILDERKKPHPCDLAKKKKEPAIEKVDICKSASKGHYKDEKKQTCVFLDPCGNPEVKPEEHTPKEKKSATKPAAKELPTEPKKPHPCDLIKKKEKADKDICKIAAVKGPHKEEKDDSCIFTDPCKSGFGSGTKPTQTTFAGSKKAKGKPEPKSSTPCQSVVSKETKKSQPPAAGKKTKKIEEPDHKDTCKDHTKADVPSKGKENKSADSCAPTPYYNPFRSEEENKNMEEEACDECKEQDPCVGDSRSQKVDYYNPFKDDKKKK